MLEFIHQIAPAAQAYDQYLRWDNRLAALLLLTFLSIAWLVDRASLRPWAVVVAGFALLGATADFFENALLRRMLALSAEAVDLAPWAAAATIAKWILFGTASGVALFALMRWLGSVAAWWTAFFNDVPHVLDRAAQRAEWLLNREFVYTPARTDAPASSRPRVCWKRSHFVLFCIVLFFVAYGPTFNGLCTTVPPALTWLPASVAGVAAISLLVFVLVRSWDTLRHGITDRFDKLRTGSPGLSPEVMEGRRNVTELALLGSVLLLLVPPLYAGTPWAAPELQFCVHAQFSAQSLTRFGVWLGAALAFGLACTYITATWALVVAQALIAVSAGTLLWFGLAEPDAKLADGLPYRHVFGALAPAVILALAVAPLLAAAAFRPPRWARSVFGAVGVPNVTRKFFTFLLARRDLFPPSSEPPPAKLSHVTLALLQGLVYRVMHIALPPALLAFMAPSDWVNELALAGLAFALLTSTWSNLSRRWRFVSALIGRWFLTGSAFFVSLFVIVVAALRLRDIDYVTTILDAATAGVLFTTVAMSYALAWLAEYWINRVVAGELLAVLGSRDPHALRMPYDVNFVPVTAVGVAADGRQLSYHGLGRFLVEGSPPLDRAAPRGDTVFWSYDLLELFRTLHGKDSERLAEVVRATSLYFYAMNAVLLLVFAAAIYVYAHLSRDGPEPVVIAGPAAPAAELKDLAASLSSISTDRPAIVIVGSGGGTRAALYTSHVLQGLHELGRDRDIVLASGVSGGGVALAYFAAWHGGLTQEKKWGKAPEYWKKFREDVAGDLIGHVVAGAAEWRIFGRTPLSTLLAESFHRHLLRGVNTTMALPDTPALILNTTISGHPVEDSEILLQTLDRAHVADCQEAARPYNMMHGGRLIFTNLKNTRAFPTHHSSAGASALANTRLPYVLVQDLSVPLERAAALSANFPPIFPNALVRIRGELPDSPCPDRSYFVTDGGALENLGLVSALYAIKSALLDHSRTCGEAHPDGACALRPLHIVVAEASAVGYDYQQDRGISAGIGGAKERMTGELTRALLDEIERTYHDNGAEVHVHYLPLPLTFRARGGFGTHWMHDPSIRVSDPRPRTPATGELVSASLGRQEVDKVWRALHDTHTPYCKTSEDLTYNKIKRWICGAPGDRNAPREIHVDRWQKLIEKLR